MSFQSLSFAGFLMGVIAVYFLSPKKARAAVLLAASMLFYLSSDAKAAVWLWLSILSTWGCGLLLERRPGRGKARAVLGLCLMLNLFLLAMFQYFPGWNAALNAAYGNGLQVFGLDIASEYGFAAPLGISFYTLQAVGYLLDVYRGREKAERNLIHYALFVSFFPNILSGPIERSGHFLKQVKALPACRLFDYERVTRGLVTIVWGYFLKMVLADRLAIPADLIFPMYRDGNSFTLLMAALFYTFQIYCDFASYSAIAIGTAKVLGIELTENFRQPYFAESISAFWSRWHISLSSWLRDYLYIPMGGSRRGRWRKYGNTMLVFLVSGLWHGGGLHYLVWGGLHGVYSVVGDVKKRIFLRLKARKTKPLSPEEGKKRFLGSFCLRCLNRLTVFLLVMIAWIFFRSDSLEMAVTFVHHLLFRWQGFLYAKEFLFAMGLGEWEMIIAGAALLVLFAVDFLCEKKKKPLADALAELPLPVRWLFLLGIIGAIFVVGKYGGDFQPGDFIYIQF